MPNGFCPWRSVKYPAGHAALSRPERYPRSHRRLVAARAVGARRSYARLADLGHAPTRFREELRSRMPSQDEAGRLFLPPGVPVVQIARTAFDAGGWVVEVNEMVRLRRVRPGVRLRGVSPLRLDQAHTTAPVVAA
ncbi:UTRA domain-containing protein [Streptomyces sp. NPDC014983]|uniref:UTRA domain-containing protein n=1 Tax=Streptomyces sp. NPDC014983 TaxID=3364933 RepID=UPI0037031D1E